MLRFIILILFFSVPLSAHATDAGWAALRNGGHIVLLRHSMISGSAEPSNFDIGQCNTQRSLSERGKQQARKIGALFGARAAPIERVQSSRYCPCLDTARIAFRTEAEPFPALDPMSEDETEKAKQKAAIMDEIKAYSGSDLLILVTHLENIQEITGVSPREGEAVIVEPHGDGVRILGRVAF